DSVEDTLYYRDVATLIVSRDHVLEALSWLRGEPSQSYGFLASLHAPAHLPAAPRFAVHYELLNMRPVERLPVKAPLADPGEPELLTINFGPHHPATHGVLRLLVALEGEVVREVTPFMGYVHTGIEKNCEDKSYWKVIPLIERMDYLAYYFNSLVFCMCVEKLLDEEVPPRGQYLRVIHCELTRLQSHLVWLGTSALDLGAISVFWYCFRERDRILDMFEMSSGQRMHTRYFQVGGVIEDIPVGFERKLRSFVDEMPTRIDQYEALLDR